MSFGLDQILLLLATQLLALLSPGPAIMALMQQAFAHGRGVGLRFGLGLSLGATLWAGFAFAGLSLLFTALPWLFSALKLFGAAYLIWMALQIWQGADRPVDTDGRKRLLGLPGGLLTNLANPKAALYFSAVFVTIFPDPLSFSSQASVLGLVFSLEALVYTCFALIFTTSTAKTLYLKAKSVIDRHCVAAIGALGLSLMLNR